MPLDLPVPCRSAVFAVGHAVAVGRRGGENAAACVQAMSARRLRPVTPWAVADVILQTPEWVA